MSRRARRTIPAIGAASLLASVALVLGGMVPASIAATPGPTAAPTPAAAPTSNATAASSTPAPAATAAPAAPQSTADTYDPGAVTDTPPAPSNNLSFTYTSSRNISPGKWQTIYTGCPAGWYVRPGEPGVWTPDDVTATYSESTGPYTDNADNDGVSAPYTSSEGAQVYQNMSVEFHNWSLAGSHHASVTFWCDKVPDWFANPSAVPSNSVKPSDVTPIDPSCYFCSFVAQYQNLATGMMLDPNGSNGSPVLVQSQTNSPSQNWYLQGASGGSDFYDGAATFGLWQDPGDLDPEVETAIQAGGAGFSFVSDDSGNPPSAGQFTYINWGAGMAENAVMFIETDSIGNGGGTCMEADGGAGSPVTAEPCDATNQAQWWVAVNGE